MEDLETWINFTKSMNPKKSFSLDTRGVMGFPKEILFSLKCNFV